MKKRLVLVILVLLTLILLGCSNNNLDFKKDGVLANSSNKEQDKGLKDERLFSEGEDINKSKPEGFEKISFGETKWSGDDKTNIAILSASVYLFADNFRLPDEVLLTYLDYFQYKDYLELYYFGEIGPSGHYSSFEELDSFIDVRLFDVKYEDTTKSYNVKVYIGNNTNVFQEYVFSNEFIEMILTKVNVICNRKTINIIDLKSSVKSFNNKYKKYYLLINSLENFNFDNKNLKSEYGILSKELILLNVNINSVNEETYIKDIANKFCLFTTFEYNFKENYENYFFINIDIIKEYFEIEYLVFEDFLSKANISTLNKEELERYKLIVNELANMELLINSLNEEFNIDVVNLIFESFTLVKIQSGFFSIDEY